MGLRNIIERIFHPGVRALEEEGVYVEGNLRGNFMVKYDLRFWSDSSGLLLGFPDEFARRVSRIYGDR